MYLVNSTHHGMAQWIGCGPLAWTNGPGAGAPDGGGSALTAAHLRRRLYAPSLAPSAWALVHGPHTLLADHVTARQAPPTDQAPPRPSIPTHLQPARWPYRFALAGPPQDQPYQPHRIPDPEKQTYSPKARAIPFDNSSRFIDLFV
jgi:hypothetical protein